MLVANGLGDIHNTGKGFKKNIKIGLDLNGT